MLEQLQPVNEYSHFVRNSHSKAIISTDEKQFFNRKAHKKHFAESKRLIQQVESLRKELQDLKSNK